MRRVLAILLTLTMALSGTMTAFASGSDDDRAAIFNEKASEFFWWYSMFSDGDGSTDFDETKAPDPTTVFGFIKIIDQAALAAYDLHPEELDGFQSLCSKYLEENATDKAAQAMLTAAEERMKELEEFNELLSSNERTGRRSLWYATGHTYASPTEISLEKYFDGGFDGEHEKTDAEYEELKQLVSWTEWLDNADFNRLPKDKINAELEKVFGITLEDLPDSAFEGLYYLESTDCYYFLQTGMTSNPMYGSFHTIEHNIDGTVTLAYDLFSGTGRITLRPNGDDWLVVSNIQGISYG